MAIQTDGTISKDPNSSTGQVITSPAISGGTIASATITGSTLAINDYQFIPVEAGIDGTSAPSAAAVYTSTNKIVARDFRGATGNHDLFFIWNTPNDLTGTTLTYRVWYLITSATPPANTETVKFTLAGAAIGDVAGAGNDSGTLISHALGSAITVTDTYATATLPAQYALIKTAWSSAVTVTHLAAGKTVIFSLVRDQANDTYGQSVGVTGFDVKFTRTLA
jgi:hypothetical protein